MKKLHLIFMLLLWLPVSAQLSESFSDGDFTANPTWNGTTANFFVNQDKMLQSKAPGASVSWLTTPSQSIDNAVWECKIRINYPTSSSNYAVFYVVSDTEDISGSCNGYYLQIGGTNDEVCLYAQKGTKKTKLIDGTDKRTDVNPLEITVRLSRTKNGVFTLSSKLSSESAFYVEGTCTSTDISSSKYIGLMYSNTSTTGNYYYFDDIKVDGTAAVDSISPQCLSAVISDANEVTLTMSEQVRLKSPASYLNGILQSCTYSFTDADSSVVKIRLKDSFQKGRIYNFGLTGCCDRSGNLLVNNHFDVAVTETAGPGDVLINEIMFNAPEFGCEYIELINNSDKVLNSKQLCVSVKKESGELESLCCSETAQLLAPAAIFALTTDPEKVRSCHQSDSTAILLKTDKWNTLNNELSVVVVCNASGDSLLDELQYSAAWHHILITDPKGVALERISTSGLTQDKNNWHSAATQHNYGTPGFVNSQFRSTETADDNEKILWCDVRAFSPDNDGNADICLIYYKTEYSGFVGNIRIFSRNGTLITTLVNNEILGSAGHYIWDGKTDRHQLAEPGIYLIYGEIFDPVSAKKRQAKATVVVTAR